jgi:hemerythrin-like domain-containing protein
MNESLTPQIPDFNDPLGILRACHERMLAHCEILQKLVPHIAENGIDDEARSAVTKVVQYFTTAALQHHQDEEINLFPVLNRQSLKLADIVHRLKKDHEQLHKLWEAVFQDLKKGSALADDGEFASHVEQFCTSYREHIEFENSELLDIAQHILSHRQLEELGDAMAKRRGTRRQR